MAPNTERLRKILTTLLIDFSEEEVIQALEELPDHYKKVTRKNLVVVQPVKVFIEVKGMVKEPREKRPPIHKQLRW